MLEPRFGSILKWKFLAALILAAGLFFLCWRLGQLPIPLCVTIGVVAAIIVFYIRRSFWEWLIELIWWW